MTTNAIAVIGALALFGVIMTIYAYNLSGRVDDLTEKASEFVAMATGFRINDPHASFGTIAHEVDAAAERYRKAGERIAKRSIEADPTNGMTTPELTVLTLMTDGEQVNTLGDIASESGLTEETVRRIVQWLKLRGLVTLGQLRDADTDEVRGRGYYLTAEGLVARRHAAVKL